MGTFTGLTPGIHVNTLCIVVLSMMAIFPEVRLICFATLVLSMSITHSFVDFIPSTFLGAPSDDTALSTLPAHKLLLEGRGYEVVIITAIGSFGAYIFAIIVLFPMIYILPFVYVKIKNFIHFILIFIVAYMILIERTLLKKIYGLTVFLLAGMYGVIVLNAAVYASGEILFPVFTGLFGISTMLLSLKDKIRIPPQQIDNNVYLSKSELTKGILTGSTAGMIVGLLPGLGSAQATVLAQGTSKNITTRKYLAAVSAVNTSNAIFCLITFFTLGKYRSGAILTIGRIMPEITMNDFILFCVIIGFVCAIATVFHLMIGKAAAKYIPKIPYQPMNITIISVLIFLIVLFTGWLGLLVMSVGLTIGLLPPILGVKRTHCMGVIILPVILYLSNLNDAFLAILGL